MSKRIREPIAAKTDWSAVLAVCGKCEDGDSSLPGRIKDAVKKRDSHKIRALKSSCLDVCPKKGVCAAIIGRGKTVAAVFDTDADADSVIEYFLAASVGNH